MDGLAAVDRRARGPALREWVGDCVAWQAAFLIPAQGGQSAFVSGAAPRAASQSRASTTTTACGPAPVCPVASTDVPPADSVPAQDLSGWRVRVTCVPGGRDSIASPF